MSDPTYSIITFDSPKLPDSYRGLVYSKWLRSHRFGNDMIKKMESGAYYKAYHTYIENLLAMPESRVRLAVLTDDPDVVLGFCVTRGVTLDYVYVHKDHRENKVAKKLIPHGITRITHITKLGERIWMEKYPHWKFNPFY